MSAAHTPAGHSQLQSPGSFIPGLVLASVCVPLFDERRRLKTGHWALRMFEGDIWGLPEEVSTKRQREAAAATAAAAVATGSGSYRSGTVFSSHGWDEQSPVSGGDAGPVLDAPLITGVPAENLASPASPVVFFHVEESMLPIISPFPQLEALASNVLPSLLSSESHRPHGLTSSPAKAKGRTLPHSSVEAEAASSHGVAAQLRFDTNAASDDASSEAAPSESTALHASEPQGLPGTSGPLLASFHQPLASTAPAPKPKPKTRRGTGMPGLSLVIPTGGGGGGPQTLPNMKSHGGTKAFPFKPLTQLPEELSASKAQWSLRSHRDAADAGLQEKGNGSDHFPLASSSAPHLSSLPSSSPSLRWAVPQLQFVLTEAELYLLEGVRPALFFVAKQGGSRSSGCGCVALPDFEAGRLGIAAGGSHAARAAGGMEKQEAAA